ncbi:MAG: dihydroneopterin aldolase [Microcystaceae cyanobacterium]
MTIGTDTIQVKNIRCYGYTGLWQEEQILGQWFEVNLTLWVDLRSSAASDDINETVDYREAIAMVKTIISDQKTKFALIEKLAQAIADQILTLKLVTQVRVELTKVSPPIPDFGGQIVIDITRSRLN